MRTKLEELRKQIDEIDEQIVSLLAKRMNVAKAVGQLKNKNNMPIVDKSRWQKVIKSKKGYIKKIWKIIHDEALRIEQSI